MTALSPAIFSAIRGTVRPSFVGSGGGLDPSLFLDFLAGAPSGLTYTGGGGTFFNSSGVLTAATTNVPRFDFDPSTLAARGMLIEEARTNLLLNSATLGTQSVTTTAVATTLSFYGTGTVTLSGTFAGTLVGAGAFPARNSLTFTPTAGTLTATVTGSVLNAQIEAGGFQTSWISTAGAAATRTIDVATMATGAWFNAAAGTLAVELMLPQVLSTGNNIAIAAFDIGTGTDTYELRQQGASTNFAAVVFVASANKGIAQTANSFTAGTVAKVAASYTTGTSQIVALLNAGSAANATPTTMPSGINRLTFGAGRNTPLNGYVRRVRFWPRALAASELQQVTT